jgi:hypothetical protein
MTDEPTPNPPSANLPPESRAARSLTDRSRSGEMQPEEMHEPDTDRGPRMWPRVVGVLILLLGASGAWVWQNPGSLRSLFPGLAGHDTEAAAIAALQDRVAQLEQRSPADLEPVTRRLDALEARLGSSTVPPSAPPTDLRPLLARLDTLEARSKDAPGSNQAPATLVPVGPDLRPVLARVEALEKERDPAKVAALAERVEALSARDPGAELRGKLDAVEHQLTVLGSSDTKLAGDAARLGRLGAADIALAAGRPLGPIPDAPEALSRFATAAPPTEAGLRLAFPPAAEAALKVSAPDTEGKPFLDRVLARLEGSHLITVREGDRVVVGNSTAATLTHARALLDAGDLGGAARAVGTLTGPAAEKMAPWLADAKALQAAREALAALAEKG